MAKKSKASTDSTSLKLGEYSMETLLENVAMRAKKAAHEATKSEELQVANQYSDMARRVDQALVIARKVG